MAKKEKAASTIENRVYLFRDLSAAYLHSHGQLLSSENASERSRAVRALADLAHAACIVADSEDLSANEIRERILSEES